MKKKYLKNVLLLVLLIVFAQACGKKEFKSYSWGGKTMGTSYHITIAASDISEDRLDEIKMSVEETLKSVNKIMSHYDPQSEISIFNSSKEKIDFEISNDLSRIMSLALELNKKSDGFYDVTVRPLVSLWGFGSRGRRELLPDSLEVLAELKKVGSNKILLRNRIMKKLDPEASVDLSSIAKGYGVDLAAKTLEKFNIFDYLVEIGGEVIAKGKNANGKLWRIGIEVPKRERFPESEFQEIIELKNRAVATSGDYRNYFFYKDKYYSHMINPKTGYPVEHSLASVTIIADNCALADGLATAVLVAGVNDGLKILENYPSCEALLVERLSDNSFKETFTSGFRKLAIKKK